VPKSGKRVNGDGSVYRRGAGWEAAITVAGTRRTERAKTKAEAEAALRRLRAQRDTGTLPRRDDTTTGEFLTSWLALRKPFLRYSTWRRYSELVAKALPVIGGLPLTTLRGVHLQNVYARTRSSGLSEQTVLSLHRVLHAALADAERWDYVVTSVARKVKAPVVRTVPPEVLSPEQVRLLLQQAPGHPLGALFTLAVTTGMRQGELLGLRWSDLDLEPGGQASVRQSMQRAEHGRVLGQPKTEKSRREVEILPVARKALLAHRRQQATLRLAAGGSWAEPDLVFTDDTGVPINPARLSRLFRAFMRSLGMDLIPFRNLRHTFATLHLVRRVASDATAGGTRRIA
jgi:integrase